MQLAYRVQWLLPTASVDAFRKVQQKISFESGPVEHDLVCYCTSIVVPVMHRAYCVHELLPQAQTRPVFHSAPKIGFEFDTGAEPAVAVLFLVTRRHWNADCLVWAICHYHRQEWPHLVKCDIQIASDIGHQGHSHAVHVLSASHHCQ